jgi:hypothetical protein
MLRKLPVESDPEDLASAGHDLGRDGERRAPATAPGDRRQPHPARLVHQLAGDVDMTEMAKGLRFS